MGLGWSTLHSPARSQRGRKAGLLESGRRTVTIIAQSPRPRTRAAARHRGRLPCAADWSVDQFARDVKGRGDVTRLSTSDASFYQLENSATPLYVGSLSILRQPRAGLSYETLLATVERRLQQVPRYRQKVREVTMGLARPVMAADTAGYHVPEVRSRRRG